MANIVREKIENLHIPHEGSRISPWVTVSIGVSSVIPDMNSTTKDLFQSVDKALYQAKNSGRNLVRYWSE